MCIELSHHFIREIKNKYPKFCDCLQGTFDIPHIKGPLLQRWHVQGLYHYSLYNDSEINTLFKSLIKLARAKRYLLQM